MSFSNVNFGGNNNTNNNRRSFGTYHGHVMGDLVAVAAWNFGFRMMEPRNRRGSFVYHEVEGDRLRDLNKSKDNYCHVKCDTTIDTEHGDRFMLIDRETAIALGGVPCTRCNH